MIKIEAEDQDNLVLIIYYYYTEESHVRRVIVQIFGSGNL